MRPAPGPRYLPTEGVGGGGHPSEAQCQEAAGAWRPHRRRGCSCPQAIARALSPPPSDLCQALSRDGETEEPHVQENKMLSGPNSLLCMGSHMKEATSFIESIGGRDTILVRQGSPAREGRCVPGWVGVHLCPLKE